MLTTGAFNALLKTLEEPPAQVLFILATTEPHKIPATIMSRTQRFDFQRLKDRDIIAHMGHILDEYQVDFENEALAIIARASNGGMRDSLSLLDQALSFNNEELLVETALQVSGSFDQITYVKYILALYQREVETALLVLDEQLQSGKQASRFIEELILFSRDVLLTMHSSANKTLLSEAELQPLRDLVPGAFYYTLINALNEAQKQMRFSNQPDLYLEVMTVQLVEQPDLQVTAGAASDGAASAAGAVAGVGGGDEAVQALQQRIAELEEQMSQLYQQVKGQKQQLDRVSEQKSDSVKVAPLNEGDASGKAAIVKDEAPLTPRPRPKVPQLTYRLRLQKVYDVLNVATRQHIIAIKQQWGVILNELSPQHRAKLMATQPLAAGPNRVLISFDNEQMCGLVQNDAMLKQLLENVTSEKLGESTKLAFILSREWKEERQNYKILHDRNNGQPVILEGQDDEDEDEVHEDGGQTQESQASAESVNTRATATQESVANAEPAADRQLTSQPKETAISNPSQPTIREVTSNIVQAAQTAYEHTQAHAEDEDERAFVDPSLEASDPEASFQPGPAQASANESSANENEAEHEAEVEDGAEDEVPAVITKAIELFGDRVNIIQEEKPTE